MSKSGLVTARWRSGRDMELAIAGLVLTLMLAGAGLFPGKGLIEYGHRAKPQLILGKDKMTRRNAVFVRVGLMKMSPRFCGPSELNAAGRSVQRFFGQAPAEVTAERLPGNRAPSTELLSVQPPALPDGVFEVSLVCKSEDLFDENRGIVAHPEWKGRDSERPSWITVRLGGSIVLEAPVGLRIHGGSSRGGPMKSFAVVFREAYGGFDRSTPGLFFGPDTQGSREWLLMAAYESSQFNNALATEMAGRLGCRVSRSAPAVLTMNGTEVLAPYFICEHQSPDFIENRYGLKDIDWYRLKGGKEPPESFIEWRRWQRRDRVISLTEEAARFDLDDLCGWVLAMSFTSTTDNDQGAYFRDRESPDSRWQTLSWDFDAAFNTGLYTHKGVTVDCSKQCFEILYGERARLFFRLMEGSPEFRSYFRQFAETRLETQLNQKDALALVERYRDLANGLPHVPGDIAEALDASRRFIRDRHDRYRALLADLMVRAEQGDAPYVFATEQMSNRGSD